MEEQCPKDVWLNVSMKSGIKIYLSVNNNINMFAIL